MSGYMGDLKICKRFQNDRRSWILDRSIISHYLNKLRIPSPVSTKDGPGRKRRSIT